MREVQPEKPAPGLATPDLVMSRAEVEHRGGADIDSGHDLLHGATRRSGRGGDGARCDGKRVAA